MTAPFGIALGSTPSDSNVIYTAVFTSIPKSHPKFPLVVGCWTPVSGLCEITGYSRWYEAGPYSLAIHSEFENIKFQLQSIYGECIDEETCHFSASCLDQVELATLPASTEVISSVAWTAEGGANLPSDLDHIVLMIQAMSDTEARICLTYAAFHQGLSLGDVL